MRFSAKRKRETVGFAIEPWPPRTKFKKKRESFSFFFSSFFLYPRRGLLLSLRSSFEASFLHAQTKEEGSVKIQISGVAVIKRYERARAGRPYSFHRWYIISLPVCRACN